MNTVWLSTRLAAKVSDPRWGGGVRRSHLAELVGLRPGDPDLSAGIGIAYRRRLVDAAEGWIFAPVPPAANKAAAA